MWARIVFALVCSGCTSAAGVAGPPPASEAASQPQPQGSAAACARPSDCGAGNVCCTTPLWDGTHCADRCDLANTGQVCAEDSECPEIGGTKTSCVPVSSQDMPSLPASLKVCQ